MTPKEKAKKLIIKFLKLTSKHEGLETAGLGAITVAKQCTLIAVDEILKDKEEVDGMRIINDPYWLEVKQEIEKL